MGDYIKQLKETNDAREANIHEQYEKYHAKDEEPIQPTLPHTTQKPKLVPTGYSEQLMNILQNKATKEKLTIHMLREQISRLRKIQKAKE